MEICNYNVDLSQVVGIGPLMVRRSSDQITRQLYKEIQLYFILIFKNVSVTIESEWLTFADHLTQEQKDKEHSKKYQFEESYKSSKAEILEWINEHDERRAGV